MQEVKEEVEPKSDSEEELVSDEEASEVNREDAKDPGRFDSYGYLEGSTGGHLHPPRKFILFNL